MADDIEVHFHPERSQLSLSCGDQAFARVCAALIAEAEMVGAIDGVPDRVRFILIEKIPAARSLASRWWHPVSLLGCGLVGFVVLFVLAVGVGTIAGWVR